MTDRGGVFNGPTAFIAGDHGTQHIHIVHQWKPGYRVESFPAEPGRVSARILAQQPSRLLRAVHQVVPFTGRDDDLEELARWRDDEADRLAVRLVHGPGGEGKSRLAAHFAELSRTAGWTVWQAVVNESGADPLATGPAPETGAGILLVVDYAERWATADLRTLLREPLLHRTGVPVRILLLARPAGLWWEGLETWIGDTLDAPAETHPVRPLATAPSARADLFRHARDSFAGRLGLPADQADRIDPPGDLDLDEDYAQILTVHIAALAAVDARLRDDKAPDNPARASAYLLKRERAHWSALHHRTPGPLSTTPETMGRVVLTATLTRQLTRTQGRQALGGAGLADTAEAANTLLDDHRSCYPAHPSDPVGAVTVLEPLYPDRLGEDFLGLTIPAGPDAPHPVPDAATDDWAHGAAARLLLSASPDTEATAPWVRDVLTVLIETARRWPHVATGELYPLLRAHPELALRAGGTALFALAEIDDVPSGLLAAIADLFPTAGNTDLDIGIAAVTARLADHVLAATDDPRTRARIIDQLALRLSRVGLRRDALLAAERATEIWAGPAAENPAAHAPDLARSLNNLGSLLSQLGRQSEALAAMEQAAERWNRLAGDDPGTYAPDLARSLNNLGAVLAELGRRGEALEATGQAVEIWGRLAADDPAAHEPNLALSLHNLGARLAGVGRPSEALAVTGQAVTILQRLTAENAAAHEPDLATSLTDLGVQLSVAERHGEALAVTEQAERILAALAARTPAAYGFDHARSLVSLGLRLAEAGRHDEALVATGRAVEALGESAVRSPAAHEPDFANSLNNLGEHLWTLGRRDEALSVTEQAVGILVRLATRNPAAHEPMLALSLNNLGVRLSEAGRPEEALAAAQEAVEIRRRLATGVPDAHEADLALSLTVLALVRARESDFAAALDLTAEAAEIYQRRVAAAPGLVPRLLKVLAMQAAALDELGRSRQADRLRRWTAQHYG
ncbi:tetratricopeptide repeat protein [Streptacidiphilus melanogenes]|uniref:tetratricopeptide repeat protein n=1 Tax=Streptacidiphilus melanogenes TaxID=411235 RepID=UPI000694A792|nr:tetratricopeptide repeat protein [Streptacidiphilus melanogenes]